MPRIAFQIDAPGYGDAYAAWFGATPWTRWGLWGAGLVAAAELARRLLRAQANGPPPVEDWGVAAAALCVAAYLAYQRRWGAARKGQALFRRLRKTEGAALLEWTDADLVYRGPDDDRRYAWSELRDWSEDDRSVAFWMTDDRPIALPKAAANPQDLADLRLPPRGGVEARRLAVSGRGRLGAGGR